MALKLLLILSQGYMFLGTVLHMNIIRLFNLSVISKTENYISTYINFEAYLSS